VYFFISQITTTQFLKVSALTLSLSTTTTTTTVHRVFLYINAHNKRVSLINVQCLLANHVHHVNTSGENVTCSQCKECSCFIEKSHGKWTYMCTSMCNDMRYATRLQSYTALTLTSLSHTRTSLNYFNDNFQINVHAIHHIACIMLNCKFQMLNQNHE